MAETQLGAGRQICVSYDQTGPLQRGFRTFAYSPNAHVIYQLTAAVVDAIVYRGSQEQDDRFREKEPARVLGEQLASLAAEGDPLTRALIGAERDSVEVSDPLRHMYLHLLQFHPDFIRQISKFVKASLDAESRVPKELADYSLFHGDHLRFNDNQVEDGEASARICPHLLTYVLNRDEQIAQHFATAWLGCALAYPTINDAKKIFELFGEDVEGGYRSYYIASSLTLEDRLNAIRRIFIDFPSLRLNPSTDSYERVPIMFQGSNHIGDASLAGLVSEVAQPGKPLLGKPLLDAWVEGDSRVHDVRLMERCNPRRLRKIEYAYVLAAEVANPYSSQLGRQFMGLLGLNCFDIGDTGELAHFLSTNGLLSYFGKHAQIPVEIAGPFLAELNKYEVLPKGEEQKQLIEKLKFHVFIEKLSNSHFSEGSLEGIVRFLSKQLKYMLRRSKNAKEIIQGYLRSSTVLYTLEGEAEWIARCPYKTEFKMHPDWIKILEGADSKREPDWLAQYLENAWYL